MSTRRDKENTQILVVEDHPVMRRGLLDALSGDPDFDVCEEVADTAEALRQIGKTKPDIAVIDLSPCRRDGLELVKAVRDTHPEVKVIALSIRIDGFCVAQALRVGALGYVYSGETTDTLLRIVHEVSRGRVKVSPRVAPQLTRRLCPAS
jgi:DNA-binding NarL/FixJ family response regulator